VVVVCLLILGGVALRVAVSERSFRYYTLDPAVTLGGSPLVGLTSQIGVLLAWGAGAVSLFAGALVARVWSWRRALPLLAVGAGTAFVAVDDLFLLHEAVFPEKLHIDETLVYLAYASVTLAVIRRYRDVLLADEWPLLALSLAMLGGSVLLDVDFGTLYDDDRVNWLEDSLKLFGLAFLCAYLLRLSASMVAAAYPLRPRTVAQRVPREDSVTSTASPPAKDP
jgi:hypothetical protein